MPKILLGISAVLAIVASVLGFMSGGKVVDLKNNVEVAKSQAAAEKGEKDKAKLAQKEAEDASTAAKAQAEQAQTELAAAKTDLEKARKEAGETKEQLTGINSQLDSIKTALKDQGVENVTDIGQMLATMKTSLEEQKTKYAEMEMKVKEAEQLVATLTQRTKDAESQKEELSKYKESREKRMAAKGLEGQVLAVNQSWNFVVLSIGDGAGVVTNAEMVVMRGGEAIAKVKITSVEKATSVADIIPGSSLHGVRVQPGDRVIYPGSQG
jgi:multidrug efflux pump subunit AcrA (membrane-fusion protein)